MRTGPCLMREYEFDNPLEWNGTEFKGVLRVDVLTDLGPESSVRSLAQASPTTLLQGTEELTRWVELHALQRASYSAMTDARSNEDAIIARTLVRAAMDLPHVMSSRNDERDRDHPSDRHQHRGYPGEYQYQDHKRLSWAKSATQDISSVLPDWQSGSSIQSFHESILTFLHTWNNSEVPQILMERRPFDTVMSAILKKHQNSNPTMAALLANASAAARLGQVLQAIEQRTAADFTDARADPANPIRRTRVYDAFAFGLLSVRGAYLNTNAQGAMLAEANIACRRLEAVRGSDGDTVIAHAGAVFAVFRKIWGEEGTLEVCRSGALTQFVPNMVDMLRAHHRDRVIEFFNENVNNLLSGETRPSLPADLDRGLESYLATQTAVPATTGKYYSLGVAARQETAYASITPSTFGRGRLQRRISVAADLHFVAPTGVILDLMPELVHYMVPGSAARLNLPNATQYILSPDDQGDDVEEDDDVRDEPMLAPVTRESVSRQSRSNQSRRPHDANASSEGDSRPPGEQKNRRVSFDPNRVADRAERMSDKATDTMRQEMTKLNETMNKKVDKHIADMRQNIDQIRQSAAAAAIKQRESLAHTTAAISKMLENIANNATDLRHADTIRNSASVASRMSQVQIAQPTENTLRGATMPAPPSQTVVTELMLKARDKRSPRQVSTDGTEMKLTHLPPNKLSLMSPEVRELYASRGIHDDEAYEKEYATKVCTICSTDNRSWPHYEINCPATGMTQPHVQEKVGKFRAANAKRRLDEGLPALMRGERLPKPTFAAVAHVAATMDESDDEGGYLDACAFLQQTFGVTDDDDADVFLTSLESPVCACATTTRQ